MAPTKKNKKQPSQDSVAEGASGGGEGVAPQQLGNGSVKRKMTFADLQEQSTLHLEADVKSNGLLRLWSRKTLLVTKGVLYICKTKSDGWPEKKVLVGEQSEVKLLAPNKKNVNRHQILLTGSVKSKVKIALDSANDQGALAKALEGEGATISGMESITIYKAFLSSRDSRDVSAPANDGPILETSGRATGDDPNDHDINSAASLATVGKVSRNSSVVGRSIGEVSNIYGDLDNKSSNSVSNDLKDVKTVIGALALDDSFIASLEGDEDSSSREVSINEPLYKNHEVKLYKQNLRLKKESEIYDKLDHGYGKQKNEIMQAKSHRPAPAVKQNDMLTLQQQLSVAESIKVLTDDEDLYETTLQIGQYVSRLHAGSIDTSNSSQRPESSQADECSSEDNPRTHGNDISLLLSYGEHAKKNTTILQSVEEVEVVCDETKDRSGPTRESLGEKRGNEGATHQPEVPLISQVEMHESNVNNRITDQLVTSLEIQGKAHEMHDYDRATDQPKTTFEVLGDEHKQINVGDEFEEEVYGTMDQESYGSLYRKISETNNSRTGIMEDSAGKLTKDDGDGIYESIWKISIQSEGSTLAKADSDDHKIKKLISEKKQRDDDCKNGKNNSIDCSKMKSDITVKTEISTKNKNLLNLEGISDQIEPERMVNDQNRGEFQESAITTTSDSLKKVQDVNSMQEEESTPPEAVSLTYYADSDQEELVDVQKSADNPEEINNFKQLIDCDHGVNNVSQSSLSLKDDGLLITFVEKITQTYGPDHAMSMVAVSRSDQPNNAEVESSANDSSDKNSELKGSESSSVVDFNEMVQPDALLGYENDDNGTVQANDGLDEKFNDEGRQKEDNNESVQHDDRHDNHNVFTENSTEPNTNNNLTPLPYFDQPNGPSTQNSPGVEEHGVSFVGLPETTAEHVSEINMDVKRKNKSIRIKTEQSGNEVAVQEESQDQLSVEQCNDKSLDQDIEDEAKGLGNLLYDATSFLNNVTFTPHDDEINDCFGKKDTEVIFEKFNEEKDTSSCLADRTSSKKTKKKVRFSDDIRVECLEDTDDETEDYPVFSEDDDNKDSETIFSDENDLNEDSVAMNDNFETLKSNSEIQQDFNESRSLSTIELTKSTSSSKSVENSLGMNPSAGGSNRKPSGSKLQQPNKVVLPTLGDVSGRGKPTSSSAIALEPNAGTCLVDYSRGGRSYQTRILKVDDGCLHFFSSPPEKNRKGSYPELGDDGENDSPKARPVHTVELGKSSVVPGLKADGEGLYSVTLTHSGGKTVLLKSPNRDEQMKLVFLLSDEVVRVTPPEDRVGLLLYPSKVKEPSNESEHTAQLSTFLNVKLTASPKVNSNSGTALPASGPSRLPKSVQNESTQPINCEPLTKTHAKEADREPEGKVSPDAKFLSYTTNSSEKQLLWQNILENRTTNFGPESVAAVAQSTIPTPSPPTPHSHEESISRSTISSSGPTKTNDKTLMSRTSPKLVPNGANSVKQNVVSNKFNFSNKKTDELLSLHNSNLSPSSQKGISRTQKKYVDTPLTGTVSKLRSIFECESKNNNGLNSMRRVRHSSIRTHNLSNKSKRRPRSMSLNDEPNLMDLNRRQNLVSTLINRSLLDGQASVPEDVLGVYVRPPSIVIKELHDDPSQAEEDGAGLSVRHWWGSRTGEFRRDSFGETHQDGFQAQRGVTASVNYASMTVEEVTEAVNPVLQAKRWKMDSMMIVADIRRTRDQLANRALEQWELAQQMDEEQHLE